MKFIDLKQHLNLKEYSLCYVLYGEDEQVLLLAENLFKSQIDESFKDFNIISLDLKEIEPQKIIDNCNTMPLLSNKKLVVLNDEEKEEKKENINKGKNNNVSNTIFNYLQEQPNNSTILIVKTKENTALFNKLKTISTLVDCNRLDTLTLKKFILSECKKKKVVINDPEILKLIEICNSDLGSITTQLSKLISVCDNNVITALNIEENCTKNLEYTVFELTDAISNKKTERALSILDDMLLNPKNQPLILPLISSHFRRLFMVVTAVGTTSQKAKDLGIKEYAVQKSEMLAKKFSKKKLMEIIKITNESELLVKSGKAGLVDTLYYLVLNIINS